MFLKTPHRTYWKEVGVGNQDDDLRCLGQIYTDERCPARIRATNQIRIDLPERQDQSHPF